MPVPARPHSKVNPTSQKILVLGAGGMLGHAVCETVSVAGHEPVAASREDVDVRERAQIERWLGGVQAVINCAAFTNVDGCESEEPLATQINGDAVGGLAAACAEHSVRLVHVSTDYVFAGDGTRPYVEQDPVAPQSAYGRSKARGERLALEQGGHVVRTSWLFGPEGPNFVETMLGLAERGQGVKVVEDQVGCPTYTFDLAQALVRIAQASHAPPSILHVANPPATSWFGFAQEIFRVFEKDVDVSPCTTDEFPRPARRPAYSVLDVSAYEQWAGVSIPSWRDALRDYRERRGPLDPSSEERAQ